MDRYPVQITVSACGDAVAIWRQSDGHATDLWANRFVPGVGWASAQRLETFDAVNATRALAIKRYVPDAGWGPTRLIAGGLDGALVPVHFPDLAVAPSGQAIVVWSSLADLWAVVIP